MPIKDRVVTWFIKNIVIPRKEIIENPGFIVNTLSQKNQETYLRELFLSEQLFEYIENSIVQKYNEQGKQALYSAGKKFGYLYSSMSNFPTINDSTEEEISDFAYFLVRFVESTYARQAEHEMNFKEKTFKVYFKDYVVCRHNGLGYTMTDGGIAGIWAYAMQDKSIEGIQLECQGRGNDRCYIVCAPEDYLKEKTNYFFQEKNLPEHRFNDEYKTLNEIRKTTYAHNSLKDLLDAGFFEYVEGILTYKNIRFFSCESHIYYLLEQELMALPGGEQVLFDTCFEYGKMLRETYGETDYQSFITDFFPALGFGDITVIDADKSSIVAVYFPWTVFSEKSKYIIFRGIMSGFVSSSLGKKIEFNNFEIDVSNYLTLTITV